MLPKREHILKPVTVVNKSRRWLFLITEPCEKAVRQIAYRVEQTAVVNPGMLMNVGWTDLHDIL